MNDVTLVGNRIMTVHDVSEALGVSEQTIRYWVRRLFPEIVKNGKPTQLNEAQATAIKSLIGSGRNDLANIRQVREATTDLEMAEKARDVLAWMTRKIESLQETIQKLEPEAQVARVIADSSGLKTLSEIGKINGLGPRKIFELLEARGFIFRQRGAWVPFQQYIDSGYFVVRERPYEDLYEETHLHTQTYVTGKGEVWLAKQFFPAEVTS